MNQLTRQIDLHFLLGPIELSENESIIDISGELLYTLHVPAATTSLQLAERGQKLLDSLNDSFLPAHVVARWAAINFEEQL